METRKKEFSPDDLQRIEEETFGNVTLFGPAQVPLGGGAHDFSLSHNYRQLWIIQKIEEIMKTEKLTDSVKIKRIDEN